jgi:hypothetical protein
MSRQAADALLTNEKQLAVTNERSEADGGLDLRIDWICLAEWLCGGFVANSTADSRAVRPIVCRS